MTIAITRTHNHTALSAEDFLFLCTMCGELKVQNSRSADDGPYWSVYTTSPSLGCVGYSTFEAAANEAIKAARERKAT